MFLGIQSAREACQFSSRANNAMARHNDGYRILPGSRANCSCRLGIAQLPCDFAVLSCLTKGNGEQSIPHFQLEQRSPQIERDREVPPSSGKVLDELPLCLNE